MRRLGILWALFPTLCLCQSADLPRFGVNIGWGFIYTCPASDSSCAPGVEYTVVPAFAYTDAQGQRTAFANWVSGTALADLRNKGMRFLRIFFSPGTDVACAGCGYTGVPIGARPILLTRGSPYVNGGSFATKASPQMQPWVYSNLKMFFQDVAAAGLEVDLVLYWDENYGYWTPGFVGYDALQQAWLATAQALVDSGAAILQIEPSQEQQIFQTAVENHWTAKEGLPGTITSRVLDEGTWGDKARGQYATEVLDATLGALQAKFPSIAGRIFPGLEARADTAGLCNSGTLNGWGDGPWSTTDIRAYYSFVASRKLIFPWLINFHRYQGLDINSNPAETTDSVRQIFDDLYAFHSGDTSASATKCPRIASPSPFSSPPYLIFGEVNSDAVVDWSTLTTVTQGYTRSRLSTWLGGGYQKTILMPWFFGFGATPFDPENVTKYVRP